MKKEGYYSSGEFAKRAHITKKTIRYYDEHGILKPSFVTDSGARFYTDDDFARLQQILLLKFLGFSLNDIREMTIGDGDYRVMNKSLNIQLKLVEDRIEQLHLIARTIRETSRELEEEHAIDWTRMLDLIHMTGMETSLKNQYKNASNISARISLHSLYSKNSQGWFPWIFENLALEPQMRILEVGCGDGTLWVSSRDRIPAKVDIILSDVSEGMLRDTRRAIGQGDSRFSFLTCDCQQLPFQEDSFDLVIANHVLFYCTEVDRAVAEIRRVLKPGGRLICGTYGKQHMKEISQLMTDFDDRIVLAAENLYERFGKETGEAILAPYFEKVTWKQYEDSLCVTEAEPLISYVLSCHGNQNQYIMDHYSSFRNFIKAKTGRGFHITKEAGLFEAWKET